MEYLRDRPRKIRL